MIAETLLLSQSLAMPSMTHSVTEAIRFSAYRRTRTRMRLTADLNFFVDDKGHVLTCESADQDRDTAAAEFVCRRVRTARFEPARDAEGEPIHGFFVLPAGPKRVDAFLTFEDVDFSGVLSVLVQVDEEGRAEHCQSHAGADIPLGTSGQRVCEIVSQSKLDIMHGADGQPVPYVRSIDVAVNMEAAD